MKILHIIPGLTHERGGPTTVVQALVRHQVAAGHQVTVLTTDQGQRLGESPAQLHGDVKLVKLPVRGPDKLAYAPLFSQKVQQEMRSADVSHVHSIFTYPVHAALREASTRGVPVVLRPCGHLHAYSLGQSRWRKRAYLAWWGPMVRRACTAWHFTSEQESAASWPHDGSQRFVLPNGIEPAEFAVSIDEARETVARMFPQIGQAPYVLFLGRIHAKKRLDLLITAFLGGAPRSHKLAVAGPDESGIYERLAARLPVQSVNRIVRVATVGGTVKAALLAGASLFALPSEHENFGIAALEALAAGTRVLLSANVDFAHDAARNKLGEVLPLEVDRWSDALAALPGQGSDLAAHAVRARAWVLANYSWERIAARLESHYRLILRGGP